MKAFFLSLTVYGISSIPFGLLFARLFKVGDIRKVGSGNIGATNVFRTGHKKAAFFTLVCDIGKGIFSVWIAKKIVPHLVYEMGFISILAHIFPIWLKFKGGKGVATALGTVIAINHILAILTIFIWLLAVKWFRISSLGALIAFSFAPFLSFFMGKGGKETLFCLGMTLVLLFTHRLNIKRLLQGKELFF